MEVGSKEEYRKIKCEVRMYWTITGKDQEWRHSDFQRPEPMHQAGRPLEKRRAAHCWKCLLSKVLICWVVSWADRLPRGITIQMVGVWPLLTKVCLVKAMVFPVVMYGCESWTIKKVEHRKLMLLNCGVGEDSWKSLGLQGYQTGQS